MQAAKLKILPIIARYSRQFKPVNFETFSSCSSCRSWTQQQCQHHHRTPSYAGCPHLPSVSIQVLLHTSASHFSSVNDDTELKAFLNEIAADFKEKVHAKEADGDRDKEIDGETPDSDVVIKDQSHNVSSNTKPIDIDEELLRYDYEEFDLKEEDLEESKYEEEEEEVYPISLTRGSTGVYDIEDLVHLLRSENARDMCVISVPPEIKFVDYMVIVTGRSARHLNAMALYVKKLYKLKRCKRDPSTSHVEGDPSSRWLAMDLGNIVLHLFTSDVRELYDLETLWTVGPKYDPLCREPEDLPDLSWVDGFTADLKQFEAVSPKKHSKSMDSLTNWHKR